MKTKNQYRTSIITSLQDEPLEEFLVSHKNEFVFQSVQFYRFILNSENINPLITLVYDADNSIVGSLLSVFQKEHAGFLGRFSTRSIIMGAPVIKDNNIEVLDFLLGSYNSYVKSIAIYSQFRNLRNYTEEEAKIFERHGYHYEAHLDILHDLTIAPEEQFAAFHKGRRKNIRKVERKGLLFREIVNDNEFKRAFDLVKQTYDRVKLPIPYKSLLLEPYDELAKHKILKVFVATHEDEIIGTRMVLCYGDSIYDWIAGAEETKLHLFPNDFLPWKVMEWGSLNGYRLFDFGGAGKPGIPYGVRDHKLKFSGELVEFGRFELVHKKSLFKFAELGLKVYKKLKR